MRCFLAPVLVLLFTWPAAAQEDVHAGRHSADAVAYLEIDGGALLDRFGQLDLVRLLDDPEMKAFLEPTRRKLGLGDDFDLAGVLKGRIPGTGFAPKDWLPGRASFALYGATLRIEGAGLKEPKVVHLNARNPLAGKQVLAILGQLAAAEMSGVGGHRVRLTLALDFSAVIEPGPKLKQALLASAKRAESTAKVRVADRDVLKIIDHRARLEDQWYFRQHFYADTSGDRWIVASSPERFVAAATGAIRSPLDRDAGFLAVRRRFAGDRPVVFAFADVAKAAKTAESAVSPLVAELSAKAGLSSVRGLGFAMSITNGGVRESLGLVLDGDPQGAWRLLDALPGGLRSVEIAPPDALAAFAVKFDAALLMKRLHEVAADLLPGAEDLLVRGLAREVQRETGLGLEADLLAAFGDEAALLVFPTRSIPDAVFGLEIRDAEAFGRVLARVREQAGALGVRFDDTELTKTLQGVQVSNPDLPLPLTYAVAKNHLFLSTNPDRVVEALTKWGAEGEKTLARDGDVFGPVMRGLNGGRTDSLVALAYVNARGMVEAGAPYLGLLAPALPPAYFNKGRMPRISTIAKYLKGAALGLRRDADGVTLDAYSPLGFVTPATVASVLWMSREVAVQRARVVRRAPQRADLGILAMRSSGSGVVVLGMRANGPAKQAGLREEDRIVSFDGAPIRTIDELNEKTAKATPGRKVRLEVVREGKKIGIDVVPRGQ